MSDYEEELQDSFQMVLREGGELFDGGGRLEQTHRKFAKRLDELGVKHALVGGYALIVHGVRRFTEDVDLLVTAEGLAVLRNELLGQGYVSIRGNERDIRDAETRVRIEFVVTGEFPGDGKQKPVAFPDPDDTAQDLGGVRVVTLDKLIELKIASGMTARGRLQDLADVQRLAREHELDDAFAEKLNPYVRERFLELLRG